MVAPKMHYTPETVSNVTFKVQNLNLNMYKIKLCIMNS